MSDLVPLQGWPTPGARRPVTLFADPYKKCDTCHCWIDGALDTDSGPLVLIPCGHSAYRDLCPSWSPVDGCGCAHAPGAPAHERRTPASSDTRHY